MRFLFLNHNLRERGTYFRAFHLAHELVRRGHNVTLWTASPSHWYRTAEETITSEGLLAGVRVIETPSWNPILGQDDGWGPIDIAWRLLRILPEPFDLLYVFAHPPNVYLPMRLSQLFKRAPIVVDWCDVYRDGIFPLREAYRREHGEAGARINAARWAEEVEARLERGILAHADAVTVISRALEEAAVQTGVPREKLLCFPSGANLEAISPQDKQACRARLGISGAGPFIGYVANYNPDEEFFLASLAKALARHPQARLLTAAPSFTESVIQKNSLAASSIQLGRKPFSEMQYVLGAADILALPLEDNPSNWGRWPNKFGDYLAAGRPVVSNTIGDVRDYFPAPDAEEAIGIASLPTPEAFGDAMASLLDNPAQWDAMGRNARALAETKLNWANLAAQAEEFIMRFVKRPTA